MKQLDPDPFEQLRRTVDRACAATQYRVSVSPQVIRELLRRLDALEAALEVKARSEPIPHLHRRTEGGIYGHSHPRGDIPHGHHGSRYIKPDNRPRIEI